MKLSRWFVKELIKTKQFLISLAILFFSLILAYILFLLKPEVKKVEPTTRPWLVEVISLEKKEKEIVLTGYGTIEPEKVIEMRPEVKGIIIKRSPDFIKGGIISKGEMIIEIDPRDYENRIQEAKAEVKKAHFELEVEMGKQIVSKREWELLDPSLQASDIGKRLALREAHIEAKEAALEGAKSGLRQAELNLERTTLYAPFNAVILEERGELGQYVSPESSVAKLALSDYFRVVVSLPYEKLRWISFNEKESKVQVSQDIGQGKEIVRQGQLSRLLGDLDPNGRMVRLVILMVDPLGLKEAHLRKFPFLIGSYVKVQITGPKIRGLFLLPREVVREDSTVWIMNDQDELEIREVEILFSDENEVAITKGIKEGEKVISSSLPLAVPGTKLRLDGEFQNDL